MFAPLTWICPPRPPCILLRCDSILLDLLQIVYKVVLLYILPRALSTYCNYLIFALPRRSLTVSLHALCQYTPDSRSFSFEIRSFSILRSIILYCAFVRLLSTNFSSLFRIESMSGQVMSGTFGAFFLIFDQ